MTAWSYSPTTQLEVERENFQVAPDELAEVVSGYLSKGARLGLACAVDEGRYLRLVYTFTHSDTNRRTELEVRLSPDDPSIESLFALSFPASRFEREFHDLFGVKIVNHPLPRRLVRHSHWPSSWYPMLRNATMPEFATLDSGYPFVPVTGEGVYEIPVGPIHAGLIEPGHFRFFAVGETVIKLKVRLWFLHKGLEKLFEGLDPVQGIALAEKISGDTSVGHSLAYTLAVEEALGITVAHEVALSRAMLVEMERLYNHVADIGALANDAGFSIGNAHALSLREELLRMNQLLTGHRLLRGAITIGGVSLNGTLDVASLDRIYGSFIELSNIILNHPIVYERFAGTATLSNADAVAIGVVGPVAKASGISYDARTSNPFCDLPVDATLFMRGDVLARFLVRVEEFKSSVDLIRTLSSIARLKSSSNTTATLTRPSIIGNQGIGIVEGWRGTITTRVELDDNGRLSRVKVVDPSWFNWPALPAVMKETIVPDFPLANKSFNLSYSGNDL